MKKLMFAALVACAAVGMTSATQVMWGFASGGIITPGGTPDVDYLDGGTALLYLGTVSFDAASGWDTSSATLIATSGQAGDPDYNFGKLKTSDLLDVAGVSASGGDAYSLILVSESGVSDIASYTGDGKYYYLSTGTSVGDGYFDSSMAYQAYAKMVDATDISGTMWSEAKTSSPTPPTPGVPEPTSGLLLVVGGAMLALRRRRA